MVNGPYLVEEEVKLSIMAKDYKHMDIIHFIYKNNSKNVITPYTYGHRMQWTS